MNRSNFSPLVSKGGKSMTYGKGKKKPMKILEKGLKKKKVNNAIKEKNEAIAKKAIDDYKKSELSVNVDNNTVVNSSVAD